ncbi:uncharacterized protein LOC121734286 [Aricia agestis]|uniref:uncharacterized protein LOC121734286 n=1 Tax=Aricia agestis TaxID=91739 RepID=UPI001C2073EE|nr:uncharacterized protein LOC121734286 [Aricia agestis]
MDKEIQAEIKEPDKESTDVKLRPIERITLHPKDPVEPSAYNEYPNYSRSWILQDGRPAEAQGSEMHNSYGIHKASAYPSEGIRKRMLRDLYWKEMYEQVIKEMSSPQPIQEYCTEYDANYIKANFEPRKLEEAADKNMHLKYPLYGTGSSPTTFYSETIRKTGPGEILEKFRKCQDFSKPMGERLDDGWVL